MLHDLIQAFVMQNGLPPQAEVLLRDMHSDAAVAVMRAGPLPAGGDIMAAFMQRVQQVMPQHPAAQGQAGLQLPHPHQPQQLAAQQVQQVQQQHQQAPQSPQCPSPVQHQMQPQMPVQHMPQAATMQYAPGQAHPAMPVMTMQHLQHASISGVPPPHPGMQLQPAQYGMQAMPTIPPAVPINDALGEFCRQNGVDAQVEQVLRGAPSELQVRVMREGPLVGGNPSEVLIARAKRIVGQASS